jgi:3-phosphoinositide dependent protein kinase-1
MLDSAPSAVSSSSSTPTGPSFPPTLADLSRNASVISSSSSSDSTPSLLLKPPSRPRPIRTFTPPRSYSPATAKRTSPASPRIATQDYLTRGLGISDETEESLEMRRASARARSQSRPRNSTVPVTTADFQFGNIIGEGSYSTVCTLFPLWE